MRSRERLLVAAVAVVLAVVGTIGLCEQEAAKPQAEEPDMVMATIDGVNVCLGCMLKKEKGADSQCSLFGHKHALKVNKAVDADGNELMEMKGWVLHYLETEKSKPLIEGHHDQQITVEGKVYPHERVIEVEFFEQAGPSEQKPAAAVEKKT